MIDVKLFDTARKSTENNSNCVCSIRWSFSQNIQNESSQDADVLRVIEYGKRRQLVDKDNVDQQGHFLQLSIVADLMGESLCLQQW